MPVSIINNTLENLDQNWESSSCTRLKSDIEALREQSDHLLELLKQLAGDNPKTSENSYERTTLSPSFRNLKLPRRKLLVKMQSTTSPINI